MRGSVRFISTPPSSGDAGPQGDHFKRPQKFAGENVVAFRHVGVVTQKYARTNCRPVRRRRLALPPGRDRPPGPLSLSSPKKAITSARYFRRGEAGAFVRRREQNGPVELLLAQFGIPAKNQTAGAVADEERLLRGHNDAAHLVDEKLPAASRLALLG